MLRAPPTESFLMPPSDPQLNKVRLGNPRVTGKEQFYTPPEIADQVMRNVKKRIGDLSGRILLEPAGGTGAFIDAAKAYGLKKVISFDIEPHHQKITLGDFLDQEINQKGLLTVTNPPFGRNNSLSIPFFNKAAQVSDLIVFVVPRSWRKWSVQNRLDQSFHLVRDDDLTINYVDVNGHDAHAKNFSLLYDGTAPTLAPLYDVLSTDVYDHLSPKMAMKLGSKYKFTEVHAKHWALFAQEAGLSIAQTKKRVLRMAQELPQVARQLQALSSFAGQPIVNKIIALIEQRSALTVRRMLEVEGEV